MCGDCFTDIGKRKTKKRGSTEGQRKKRMVTGRQEKNRFVSAHAGDDLARALSNTRRASTVEWRWDDPAAAGLEALAPRAHTRASGQRPLFVPLWQRRLVTNHTPHGLTNSQGPQSRESLYRDRMR